MATIEFDKIVVTRLSDTTIGIQSFDNRNPDMIKHIRKDALYDQDKKLATTWVWVYDNKIMVGYVSLAMYSIDRNEIIGKERSKYRYGTIPSLLIGQIATHRKYENNGIGTSMVLWAFTQAKLCSKMVGCRTIALHPLEEAMPWYREKFKFKLIKREKKQDIMYFDLYNNNGFAY